MKSLAVLLIVILLLPVPTLTRPAWAYTPTRNLRTFGPTLREDLAEIIRILKWCEAYPEVVILGGLSVAYLIFRLTPYSVLKGKVIPKGMEIVSAARVAESMKGMEQARAGQIQAFLKWLGVVK
ncbi:MAG: hypothetical protein PHI12_13270 [Dehalococcoidales bacterium]|nr:hypothetical protein [Dehalococcoidales bacterium]